MAQILLHKQPLTEQQVNDLAAQGVIAIQTDKPKGFQFLDLRVPQIEMNDMVWALLDAANTSKTYASDVRCGIVENLAKLAKAKHEARKET